MSEQRVKLRPPATIDLAPCAIAEDYQFLKSAHTSPGKYSIRFRHPAYPPEENVLLTLHAWDHADGGLHYGLAHTACAIIADNRFDGYLSTSNLSNSGPLVVAWDDILPAGICDYYFHVPHPEVDSTNLDRSPLSPYRWPVVPSFQDWRFPSTLPQCWLRCNETQGTSSNIAPQSSFTAAIRQRDIQCRITAFQNGTEVAHLVPAHEKAWFLSNSMDTWNNDSSLDSDSLLKDLSNAVLLRSDIHTAFDQRKFVFFPKEDAGFALHMLQPTSDLGPLYHNRRLVIPECNIAFLFARFAWSIFPSLTGFLVRSPRDRLVVRLDIRAGKRITEEVPAAVLSRTISASRSNSPTKRARADTTADEEAVWRSQKCQRLSSSLPISTLDLECNSSAPSPTKQRESVPLAGLFNEHKLRHEEQNTPGDTTSEHEDAAKFVERKWTLQNIPNLIHGKDETTFQHLCKTYLEKQRPEGYIPPRFIYDRRRPAKEQLELMGVEILVDSFSDDDEDSRDKI